MDVKQRLLSLPDGRRTSIKLDSATWAAIDLLADQAGQPWAEWCRAVIRRVGEGENMTAAIRTAAMDGILAATFFTERADLMARGGEIEHPMLQGRFGVLNDAGLADELKLFEQEYLIPFAAFDLLAGRRLGKPVVIVRSKLEGDQSALLSAERIED